MAKQDPAERLAAAAERIAKSLAELVELQRGAGDARARVAAATMPETPATPFAGLSEPVAQLAQAVSNIAATNAQLAAERREMRKLKERELAELLEDTRRVGAMGPR